MECNSTCSVYLNAHIHFLCFGAVSIVMNVVMSQYGQRILEIITFSLLNKGDLVDMMSRYDMKYLEIYKDDI